MKVNFIKLNKCLVFFGFKVSYLKRIQIGNLKLGNLEIGEIRKINKEKIKQVWELNKNL